MASLLALIGLDATQSLPNTTPSILTPSLLVVLGTVGLIAAVTYAHDSIPVLNSLFSLQLPLCLYLFVVVKTVVRLVDDSPSRTHAPTLPEIYRCMQVMVSEMYVTFLLMLAAKFTMQS